MAFRRPPSTGLRTLIGAACLAALSGTAFAQQVQYTASGTYTVPADVIAIQVAAAGGGGGGGGYDSCGNNTACAGNGGSGGAGALLQGTIAVTPGSTVTIVVGAGGSAGAPNSA